jgi:hypothetical protein
MEGLETGTMLPDKLYDVGISTGVIVSRIEKSSGVLSLSNKEGPPFKNEFRQPRAGFQKDPQSWQTQDDVVETTGSETILSRQGIRAADERMFLTGSERRLYMGYSMDKLRSLICRNRKLYEVWTCPEDGEQVNNIPIDDRVDAKSCQSREEGLLSQLGSKVH